MALVDVVIPTAGRATALAVVLTSLLGQTFGDFDVTISDQTLGEPSFDAVEIATLVRALRRRGHRVELHHHLPRRGMAEQRHFLLSRAPRALRPFPGRRRAAGPAGAGAHAGCAARGGMRLRRLPGGRPGIPGRRAPTAAADRALGGAGDAGAVRPDDLPWERHLINNAANPLHLEARLCRDGAVVAIRWPGSAAPTCSSTARNCSPSAGSRLAAAAGGACWRRGGRPVPPHPSLRRLWHAAQRHVSPGPADDHDGPAP